MPGTRRDEFNDSVKRNLAMRVACKCSKPGCGIQTHGPNSNPEKATIVGKASHICAAAKGGPRYDPNMTKEERKSINNAIWLCAIHADEVDKDIPKYSVKTLREWKDTAEQNATHSLGKSRNTLHLGHTLLQLGNEIVVFAMLESLTESQWQFQLLDFMKGTDAELLRYCAEFSTLTAQSTIVVIESYGDGRTICEPPRVFVDNNFIHLSLCVDEPYPRKDPHQCGMSFAISDGFDIFARNGDIATVRGIDAAKQSLRTLLGMKPGEAFYNPELGSRFFLYYQEYQNQPDLLERFVKLEIMRLASIKLDSGKPQIPYIKRVLDVHFLPDNADGNILAELEILWGNDQITKDVYIIFKHSKNQMT